MAVSERAESASPPGVEPGDRLLWAGMVLPPLLFLLSLAVEYAMVRFVCASGSTGALHIGPPVALLAVIVLGLLVWRDWGRLGKEPPTDAYGSEHSRSFMAVLGIASSGLFAVLLAAQWLAIWLLPHCRK